MKKMFVRSLLPAAIFAGLWGGVAIGEDLSVVVQWKDKYPLEKIVNDKPLWDQPAVLAAMRAAMGERLFALEQKSAHNPEAPVAGDGKGVFVAWSCVDAADCGGNQITVFFDPAAGTAQICWRSSEGIGGKVQDSWLAKGDARPLPINGCGIGQKDPFASLKKYGGGK